MALTQLNARVPAEVAASLRARAQRAGMSVQDYLTDVIAADEVGAEGPEELRQARARMHAVVAYKRWKEGGQSEVGAMSMAEVFGE